jgi:predicted ribosome quality control (RQC) complex YloA/Tae2 family protein
VASKGKRYRTVVVDGFEVLVGKGDEDNDALTFDIAAPEDFWLHVAGGIPGSHVVVRNPENLDALPRPVIERAAELAAWHSKGRGAGRVEVHVCRVADVYKRRGSPPGQVFLRRWGRVRVTPKR